MALSLISRVSYRRLLKSRPLLECEQLVLSQSKFVSNFSLGIGTEKIVNSATRKFSITSSRCHDSDSVSCWKCGVTVDLNKVLFCDYCDVVQKPKHADYFVIFGLKREFDIDTKKLTKNFRLLQMQLHPDRFSQKSEDEKEISAGYSSLLNQAYKTLSSQLERGLYLLEIEGHPLLDEAEVAMGPEFLGEIMEINEAIHEAEESNDLQTIKKTNADMLSNLFRKAAEEFRNESWESARDCLARVKYYSKIEERIKELEQEIEDRRT